MMAPESIARYLAMEARVHTFFKAVNSLALNCAQTGTDIPGYKVVLSRRSRQWVDEAKVEQYLSEEAFIQARKPGKLIPIGEAEKQLKQMKITLPEDLTFRPPGCPTLVTINSPQTAIVSDDFMALPII
jgi:hypothetical protein